MRRGTRVAAGHAKEQWTKTRTRVEGTAYGTPSGSSGVYDCDIVEISIGVPPSKLDVCPPPNTSTSLGGVVEVWLNEQMISVLEPNGECLFGAAAAHIRVTTATTVVDAYLGLIFLDVSGDPLPPPPVCDVLYVVNDRLGDGGGRQEPDPGENGTKEPRERSDGFPCQEIDPCAEDSGLPESVFPRANPV